MYQIIKNGKVVALTDSVCYIKVEGVTETEAPRFVPCDEEEAQGVAVNGRVYSLFGCTLVPDLDEVIVHKKDGGKCIAKAEENAAQTDALVVDHEYRLILLEMGVAE